MDNLDGPVAAVATLIILAVLKCGLSLHKAEKETGQEPRFATLFIAACVATGGAIIYLGETYEFFGDLTATLTFSLLTLFIGHLLARFARSVLKGRNR